MLLYHVLMANKGAFKSHKNIVYACKYQVIWTAKYRRKVLIGGVGVRLKEIVREAAEKWQCEIHELEVLPDQAHALRSSATVGHLSLR